MKLDQNTLDANANVTETKMTWIEEKAFKANKRKLETTFETLETDIHQTEETISELETKLLDESVYTNHIKASEITTEKSAYESTLERLYEEWESITMALEKYSE